MKKVCPLCGTHKAKRACLLPAHDMICPLCCAAIRNAECKGCHHYEAAEEYRQHEAVETVADESDILRLQAVVRSAAVLAAWHRNIEIVLVRQRARNEARHGPMAELG